MLIWQWNSDRKEWEASPIGPEGAALAGGFARLVHLAQGGCALLSRGGVSVNGVAALPLVVLADRDEIQLRGGSLPTTNEDILLYCRRRLSNHKVPASLNFVTELNLTSSGKVRHG